MPPTKRSTTRPDARVESLTAYHSLYYSQGRAGYLPSKTNDEVATASTATTTSEPSLRPLVKVHPDTGRPNLCIGRHAYGIVGMDPDESERFLDELNEWACQPPRIYFHQWEVGDAVDLGQPPADAPGHAVRHDPAAPDVAHPHRRRARRPSSR